MKRSFVGSALVKVGAAAAVAAGGLVGVSPAAEAGIHCEPGTSYRIKSHSASFRPAKNTYFKDGRGGTMTVSVETASTLSGTFGTTVEAEINAIFSKVKTEVNASVTKSKTVTTGHQYSHKISANNYGNMQYGSWGTIANWEKVWTFSNCGQRVDKTGAAKLPGKGLGWKYWETSY